MIHKREPTTQFAQWPAANSYPQLHSGEHVLDKRHERWDPSLAGSNVAVDFEDAISYSSTMSAVGKARVQRWVAFPRWQTQTNSCRGIDVKHLKAIYLDQCSHIYSRECRDVSQLQRWILSTKIRCFFFWSNGKNPMEIRAQVAPPKFE